MTWLDPVVIEVQDPTVVIIEESDIEVVEIKDVGPRGPIGPAGVGFDLIVSNPQNGDIITYFANDDQWRNERRTALVDGGNF